MILSIIIGDRVGGEHNMAWEQRGHHHYYYRALKVLGRVYKEYVGTGPLAEIAAERDALAREARADARESQRREQADMRALDVPVETFADSLETLTRASLLLAGYHRHHGEWRMRRHG
jgi:hypothetical protein